MPGLEEALRTPPECEVRVQKITLLADPRGVANWDAEFEAAEDGERPTAEQRRVMLAAKLGVEKRLDLAKSG
jgi:hypothetical protein